MIKGHAKKIKMAMKDDPVPIELSVITLDGEEMDSRRQVMSEAVEIKSDLPPNFDKPHLNMNGEEILDQRREVMETEDSGKAPDNSMTKNCRIVEAGTGKPYGRNMSITDSTRADADPIVEYAEVPLLPLSKACAPLTNILHDLSFYIQMALDKTSEQPADGLTVDESAAICLYTIEWDRPHRSLYSMLNHALKKDDRADLQPYFKYLKLFLTAVVKLPCLPPLTIWRGVTKNASAEFSPDTSVTWWAFSSCTVSLPVLENNMYLGNTGDRTLFSVEAINSRAVRSHSYFNAEDEILLLPGTRMVVQSQFSPAPDLHIIHLKQVVPEAVLLKPPFEGK
jgi:hypothetical protein